MLGALDYPLLGAAMSASVLDSSDVFRVEAGVAKALVAAVESECHLGSPAFPIAVVFAAGLPACESAEAVLLQQDFATALELLSEVPPF